MSISRFIPQDKVAAKLHTQDPQALERICSLLDCLPSQLHSFVQLTGGLTNQTYAFEVEGSYGRQGRIHEDSKVELGDRYVYRFPSHLYDGNLIFRNSEAEAELLAHKLGLDPSLIYLDPQEGWKLSHYLPGARSCTYQDFEDIKEAIVLLSRIKKSSVHIDKQLELIEHIHSVAEDVLTRYEEKCRQQKADTFYLCEKDIKRLRDALDLSYQLKDYWESISTDCHLVHLDFWPPNILKWEGGLAIIDWEYCCNAPGILDPASIIAPSQELSFDQAQEIFCCYFEKDELESEDIKQMCTAICLLSAYWLCWSYMREDVVRDQANTELEDACYFNCVNYGKRALAL